MDRLISPEHPVLRHLAILRAARDFGLHRDALEPLALRFAPEVGHVEEFADAVTTALLGQLASAPRR